MALKKGKLDRWLLSGHYNLHLLTTRKSISSLVSLCVCVCEYNDVKACDREKVVVERWRWPKWQRQIEISKGYRLLSAKVTQAITWHIDLYPLRQTLLKARATHKHPHAQTQIVTCRPCINLVPAPNYYCFFVEVLWSAEIIKVLATGVGLFLAPPPTLPCRFAHGIKHQSIIPPYRQLLCLHSCTESKCMTYSSSSYAADVCV